MKTRSQASRTLFSILSVRLALVGLAFMLVQLVVVVWMYVNNPNDLDQLLVTAEADRIAAEIPRMRTDAGHMPANLRTAFVAGTQRAFLIHERSGAVVARFDDGELKLADEPPASFLVIRTQREAWGNRFLLSGTRRVMAADRPFWITVAIAGEGFWPFIPVIYNEVRVHVIFPVILLSVMFLFFNISVARSTLKPLKVAIAAVNAIEPAQVSTRIDAALSSREVQALVTAVNRMLERVERSVCALRDFAGDAAHELRTPLAIMLLSIGKLPNSDARSRLLKDVQGMKRLVDQMLDMAQVTAIDVDRDVYVSLTPVARDVVTGLTPLAIARGRSIRFHDAGASLVRGHGDAIGRALRNIVENALTHTPAGTEVEVTSGPGGCYTVRDHGPGIAPERRAKVLERFHRIDKSRGEGTGLGLAIALAIAEAHGGTIEIGEASGGGALVRLILDRNRPVVSSVTQDCSDCEIRTDATSREYAPSI